ncbi:hypothetical protein BJ165DRAFT_922591 [Panaeolus papilionaceus]|nr:hypothetical protein BJ165DRAFT_922591 [Panaeolus papilionaceus]
MPHRWNVFHSEEGSSEFTMERPYLGYDNAPVQNPEHSNTMTNNLPWGRFSPLPSTNTPLLDWNAPMDANGPNTFAYDTMLWAGTNLLHPPVGAERALVPPQFSFPTPKFPVFQPSPSQALAVTMGAPFSPTPINCYMVSEPHFDPGRRYDLRYQGAQTQPSRGLQVPNDEQIEASRKIVEIMTSFKIMPNQDEATLHAETARARETLTNYISSLPQYDYCWIENQRRKSIGAPSSKTHSATRRKHVDERGLYLCLWCKETLTTKLNFSNHIRAHLKLHLSFCDRCGFSSVTPRLPIRHKCRKSNGNS